MFNRIFKFSQDKLSFLYDNSLFLQHIDKFILFFIMVTFLSSTFMNSDSIGFFALIAMFLTIVKMLTKPNEKLSFKHFEIWLVAYFMLVVVSLFGSTLFELSLKGFFKTFVYLGFYFSVAQYLKNNTSKIPVVMGTMVLCICGESIVGFLQSFLHLDEISTWQDTSNLNPEDVLSRVYGTLKPLNPNLYGGYLVAGLGSVIGSVFYFLNKKQFKLMLVAVAFALLTVYTILQTGCRGAYIGLFLISSLIFTISLKYFWPTYKKIYFTVLSSVLSVCMLAIIGISSLRARVISIFAMRSDSSNSFRFNVYQSAIQMFKDNWAIGIGMGNQNFREIYGLYMKTGFDALSAYNIYLETAVESGIFTLLAFLCFLFSIVIDGAKYILKSKNTNSVIFASIGFLSICGVMIHGMVDTVFFRPQIQITFWTMVALLSSQIYSEN